MTEVKYYCGECDGRTCALTSNKMPKQSAETCPWSNVVGYLIPALWTARVGPADIPKPKEDKTDG